MNVSYSVTLVLHHAWNVASSIKDGIRDRIHHRFHYGKAAERRLTSNLGLCHYRWIDGRQYTLIQPLHASTPMDISLVCAIVIYTDDSEEIDVTSDVLRLAGPHLDFHGSELTVEEILTCLDLDVESFGSLCLCTKTKDVYTDIEYQDLGDIARINKNNNCS